MLRQLDISPENQDVISLLFYLNQLGSVEEIATFLQENAQLNEPIRDYLLQFFRVEGTEEELFSRRLKPPVFSPNNLGVEFMTTDESPSHNNVNKPTGLYQRREAPEAPCINDQLQEASASGQISTASPGVDAPPKAAKRKRDKDDLYDEQRVKIARLQSTPEVPMEVVDEPMDTAESPASSQAFDTGTNELIPGNLSDYDEGDTIELLVDYLIHPHLMALQVSEAFLTASNSTHYNHFEEMQEWTSHYLHMPLEQLMTREQLYAALRSTLLRFHELDYGQQMYVIALEQRFVPNVGDIWFLLQELIMDANMESNDQRC